MNKNKQKDVFFLTPKPLLNITEQDVVVQSTKILISDGVPAAEGSRLAQCGSHVCLCHHSSVTAPAWPWAQSHSQVTMGTARPFQPPQP